MKKFILIILSACIAFSCTKKAQDDVALTVGVMPSMDYLPLAVAEREGYFDKLGIKVDIRKFNSVSERDAAFQSGNVDGTVIDYTGAALRRAGGLKLKLVSACDAPFYIVASKDSGIKNIAGLKGKKIAITYNTVIDYFVDKALASSGLSSADVERVDIGMVPLRYEMLRNNKIDAAGLPNPLALKAVVEGETFICSSVDLGLSITGIIFSEKSLEAKNDLIKKMYEAYNMGVEYILSHSVEEIKDILIKDMSFTEALIAHVELPVYTKARTPSDEDMEEVINWLKQRGLLEDSFDGALLVDKSIIK